MKTGTGGQLVFILLFGRLVDLSSLRLLLLSSCLLVVVVVATEKKRKKTADSLGQFLFPSQWPLPMLPLLAQKSFQFRSLQSFSS